MKSWITAPSFLKKKNKIALLFFPCDKKGSSDAVQIFHHYITDKHKRIFWYKKFDKLYRNRYIEIFGDINPRKIPKSIILFAHPSKDRKGFVANPSNGASVMLPEQWKCNIKYDWLFAHVCNGAEILNQPKWREIFPNWVSYSGDITSYVATEKGNSCWESVTHSILEEIPKSKSIKSMKERLLAIYYNAMAELYDTYEPRYGDTLNLMYLENCIQNIKTSEDY